MAIDENLRPGIRRKLETLFTAEEAEAVMTELSTPSVDEQFAALQAMLVSRFDQIDSRFDDHDRRFDQIEVRLDQIEVRLDRVEARLDQIEVRLDRVEARLDQIEVRLDRVEARLDQMDIRFDQIDARFHGQDRLFAETDRRFTYLDTGVGSLNTEGHRLGVRVDANNDRIDKLAYWLMWALVVVASSIVAGIGLAFVAARYGT